jgi:hypothetical protein
VKFELVQTSRAWPEQYDVYLDGEEIGYMRVRHGYYSAEYKGVEVFCSYIDGDGFFDDGERDFYLRRGLGAIEDAMTNYGRIEYTIRGNNNEEVLPS